MDLLQTILVYMAMVYASSVQTAPMPDVIPSMDLPTPTPLVEVADTPTPVPTPSPTPVPTIDISPNPEYGTIRVGDNGDEVRAMQEKLAELGYYTGEVDGRFGNQTRRAVQQFQYQHGLSVDGIAGRRTLTVLYESDEVRAAPVTETPSPSATQTPAGADVTTAVTDAAQAETPQPTFAPIQVPDASNAANERTETETSVAPATEPTQSAAPAQANEPEASIEASTEPTNEPTATPAPEFLPMEGYTITLADGGQTVMTEAAEGEDAAQAVQEAVIPYSFGETLYVPFLSILRSASLNIISTDTIELDEYAFALGDDIYRLTLTENQAGEPTDLKAYKNGEEQTLPNSDLRLVANMLYFPTESLISLTGTQFEMDETLKRVAVVLPTPSEE